MTVRFAPGALRQELTPVDNRFILEYLPHAGGLAVQVYLYGLLQCRFPSASEGSLADALGLSDAAVLDAYAYWQAQGLVRIRSEKPLIVEYLGFDEAKADASAAGGKYVRLVSALNALTAPRQFDIRELRHVYDWVEVYGLEEDAALELASYCMDKKGRRVSVNYMDAVAQSWAEAGIRTRADAAAFVEQYDLKKHGATAILRQWNKNRRPTRDEMALYEKWTGEWGFSGEAVLAVLPRLTVSGSPNFTYLDEALHRLKDEGVTGAADIAENDARDAGERAFARLLFDRAGKQEQATKTQLAQINLYVTEYAMPRELLLFGAEHCRGANEPFGLMKKLWNEWHEQGVDTLEKAEAALNARSAGKPSRQKKQKDYAQHTFTDEQLDSLLIDLDKEV